MRTAIFIFAFGYSFLPIDLHGQEKLRIHKTFRDSTFKIGDKILAPVTSHTLSGGMRVIPEHYDSVKVIADFLERHPDMLIELGAHTDDRGDKESNLKLSEHRARTIKNVLVATYSIHPERVLITGYGESDPIIPIEDIHNEQTQERKEELYAINRRIEIKIIEKHTDTDNAVIPKSFPCDSLAVLQVGIDAIIAKYPN
ncbi:MAG: OmpA family protein, partial [Bacteroidota bacterium]|nr:OmpA family protein [Bacteroidota bacterium]